MARKQCSVDGCESNCHSYGFCNLHSKRFQRNGDPLKTLNRNGCKVAGCNGKHKGHGYCEPHYRSWKRHGSPHIRKHASPGESVAWLRENIKLATPNECLIWPFGQKSGYGTLVFQGVNMNAHRAALIILTGRNPPSLVAAHGPCHNRLCCNPHHMTWKTHKENADDRNRDGTDIRGEQVFNSKLTNEQVILIRDDNRTHKQIAADFGISQSSVSMIKSRKRWKHV